MLHVLASVTTHDIVVWLPLFMRFGEASIETVGIRTVTVAFLDADPPLPEQLT